MRRVSVARLVLSVLVDLSKIFLYLEPKWAPWMRYTVDEHLCRLQSCLRRELFVQAARDGFRS